VTIRLDDLFIKAYDKGVECKIVDRNGHYTLLGVGGEHVLFHRKLDGSGNRIAYRTNPDVKGALFKLGL
jgi:hypothetical protein